MYPILPRRTQQPGIEVVKMSHRKTVSARGLGILPKVRIATRILHVGVAPVRRLVADASTGGAVKQIA